MPQTTVTLYWPDVEDPRYADEQTIIIELDGGLMPVTLRIPAELEDGTPVFDVFAFEADHGSPDIFFRHTSTIPRP